MAMADHQDRRARRALEILTGATTWGLISSPVWAAALIPDLWPYVFTAFALYWLYRTACSATYAVVAYRRIMAAQRMDASESAAPPAGRPGVRHLVVFPTYNERVEVLEESLRYLARQDIPLSQILVVLAFEGSEPATAEKALRLRQRFQGVFGRVWETHHPLTANEPSSKAANLAHAVPLARELLLRDDSQDLSAVLLTVCDADSRLHPKYLSALTDAFLADPNRQYSLFQPALLFLANRHRLPFILRPINGLHSIVQLSRMPTPRKLITQSTYSLSLEACHEIGYWDAEVVPEDSHTFFKMLFRWGGKTRVHPIYLPVLGDAPEGASLWRTILGHYRQARRWSWGVSDVPWLILTSARGRQVPLLDRVVRVGYYVKEHVLWPVHWFLLAGGVSFVPRFSPEVASTPVFGELSLLASAAIGVSALLLVVLVWVDIRLSSHFAAELSTWQRCLSLLAWAAVPVVGLPLLVLPAVEAHARLLLGRRLGYQVTDKGGGPHQGEEPASGVLTRAGRWAS